MYNNKFLNSAVLIYLTIHLYKIRIQITNKKMQQPQSSSSTLQNYISSGDNQDSSHHPHNPHNQTNSSCTQCNHINQMQNQQQDSSSESGSSSHDDGQLVQPLHRHIVQHSRHIQNTIANFQIQIQRLKRANDTKDILIDQLRKQLKNIPKVQTQNKKQSQNQKTNILLNRQRQIQQIRKQIYQNAEYMMKNNNRLPTAKSKQPHNDDSNNSLDELKQRMKNIQVHYYDRRSSQDKNHNSQNNHNHNNNHNHKYQVQYSKRITTGELSSSSQSSQEQQKDRNKCDNNNRKLRRKQQQQINNENSKNKNKQKSSNNNLHKQNSKQSKQINNHQDQYSQIIQQLNTQIQKVTRLQRHIQYCQQQMVWMTNFLISFIKMGEKFMSLFNELIIKSRWSLKKKTKVCWRYVKHVLSYLIS